VKRRELLIALGGGALVAWPLTARAQQKAMPVVGYLNLARATRQPFAAAFRQGLKDAGFIEGQKLAIEYRWAEDQYDRLPGLATDLVGFDCGGWRRGGIRGKKRDFDDPDFLYGRRGSGRRGLGRQSRPAWRQHHRLQQHDTRANA
jgi:hypothetical protein